MFPPNTKVLVIDDMLTMRKLVSRCLKDIGFTDITEADDGETAWPLLEAGASGKAVPFQLVVSDWNMPKLTGIALLKKVRGHEAMKNLPFLFVTAEAEKGQILEAIQAGVSNYITKPFTPATMKEKLLAVWSKHHPK
ncbi:MAG: response regulator [Bdellovibrionales bacterium]|nr:response regulator [Bdellovibrionales bacterium]